MYIQECLEITNKIYVKIDVEKDEIARTIIILN